MRAPCCGLRRAAIARWLPTITLVALAGGCREQPTTVTGDITLDGHALTVASDARGTVVFQPHGGRGVVATGLLDPAGHYKLSAGSSGEVPAGKYYVTVSVAKLLPATEGQEQGAELITPKRYTSAQESGLEAEVKPGENALHFNLESQPAAASAPEKPAAAAPVAVPADIDQKADATSSEKPPAAAVSPQATPGAATNDTGATKQ